MCVKTLFVSLPSNNPAKPRLPCDAIKIKSHFSLSATSMMALKGESLILVTTLHLTPTLEASLAISLRYLLACSLVFLENSSGVSGSINAPSAK